MKHLVIYSLNFFFLSSLLLFTGCGDNKPSEEAKQESRQIKMIDLVEANNLHCTVADRKGYFKEEGLNVNLTYESAGLFAMNKLESDEADYAVIVEMNLAKRVFDKDDIVILTELAEPITAIKIVGRKDKGIEEAKDLIGKKIGLLQGVNIHKYMLMYLEEHGISPEEVDIVNMKPPQAKNAFQSGQIDATILWQPHIFKLQQALGDKMVVLTDDGKKYWPYDMVLATKKSTLEHYPEEAEKILKALVKADQFINDNEEESKAILASLLGMETEEVAQFWNEVEFNVELTDTLRWKMEEEVEWFQELGLKKRPPVDTSFIDNIADILPNIKE